MASYLKDPLTLIFLLCYIAGTIICFAMKVVKFSMTKENFYIYSLVGVAGLIAKGAAGVLNYNCGLVLFPVCRNLITLMRQSCCLQPNQCHQTKYLCRIFDHHIKFHKLCGYSIVFWTIVHLLAHCMNLKLLQDGRALALTNENYTDLALHLRLSLLPLYPNETWVNPIREPDRNLILEMWVILPGWTGVIATVIVILMMATALTSVRRSMFEVFIYTHQLFVLFFVFIILHAYGGIVRDQGNVLEHNPLICSNITVYDQCKRPEFVPHQPETWIWVIASLIFYLLEKILLFINWVQPVEIVQVIEHPSNVLELRMKRRLFSMRAGQYIYVNCPRISWFQWHPFTLTSAPEDDYFSVHICKKGDWTENLFKAFKYGSGKVITNPEMPRICINGPFGTCSDDVFRYETSCMVGAGIGVTPYASILKHICNVSISDKDKLGILKSVNFFWVCPQYKSFEWFQDILKDLEEKMVLSNKIDFFKINLYWTRGWTHDDFNLIHETNLENQDPFTGLQAKTNFGRPNWDQIFSDISESNERKNIGVFFCGAKALSTTLEKCCTHATKHSNGNTKYFFHKENF